MTDKTDKSFNWFYLLIILALIILVLSSLIDGTFDIAMQR